MTRSTVALPQHELSAENLALFTMIRTIRIVSQTWLGQQAEFRALDTTDKHARQFSIDFCDCRLCSCLQIELSTENTES
eukprot:9472741-Pyramimonas_sp.AAC.1